jgi:hypothetical protein
MAQTLNEIFSDLKMDTANSSSLTDFAAGYGRFTRFLPFPFPFGIITDSDDHKNAVSFYKKKIGLPVFTR